jgi:hypothetical protein
MQKVGIVFFLMLFKGQYHEIFASSFFHESSSPNSLKITVRSIQIFSTIHGEIRKSRCITCVHGTGGTLK